MISKILSVITKMSVFDNLITCCATTVGCATMTFLSGLFVFFVLFDLLCLVSTFYWKDIYEKCPQSDLVNYMIFWIAIPYMFLEKDKTIKTITKVIRPNPENQEETDTQTIANTRSAHEFGLSDMIFYLAMFIWGIKEFKVSCVEKLQHNIIYSMSLIITIFSGIASIGMSLLICCAGAFGHVRNNPNERYGEYRLVQQA